MKDKELKIPRLTPSNKSITIDLPSSKSISNRALILQYILQDRLEIQNLSSAHDTQLLQKVLLQLKEQKNPHFDIEDAGTAARFMTALLAITPGKYTITGTNRMKQRPIQELVDMLISMGAEINYQEEQGFLPLSIHGKELQFNPHLISSRVSSQFLSALLLIYPHFREDASLAVNWNDQVSSDYVLMTIKILQHLHVDVKKTDQWIHLKPNRVREASKTIQVESDWSSASYWYEVACINPGLEIHLPGLIKDSWQGDAKCADYFKLLGVQTHYYDQEIVIQGSKEPIESPTFDLSNTPDLFPALCLSCALLNINASFTGISHLIYKESNRIQAIAHELNKIGIEVLFDHQHVEVKSQKNVLYSKNIYINTYQDHRIAMAFTPFAFKQEITIQNPEVVEKSYPDFWKHISSLTQITQPFT